MKHARKWLRGSWPVLLAGSAVFLVGFALLRADSRVLRAERDHPAAAALARRHGLEPASVLALRAQVIDLDDAAFAARVQAFAALRRELGEPLAAVALATGEERARALLQAAGGDAETAWERVRNAPAALAGVEFELMRERFAARRSGAH